MGFELATLKSCPELKPRVHPLTSQPRGAPGCVLMVEPIGFNDALGLRSERNKKWHQGFWPIGQEE